MSISKKILTATLALIGAVCFATALFFMPSFTAAAEEELSVVSGLDYFKIEDGEFQGLTTSGLTVVGKNRSKLVIPNTVTSVADGVADGESAANPLFGNAIANVVEIEFNDATKIVSVGEGAFAGCISLKKINLGDATNVTEIGAGAFRNCTSLETLSLGSAAKLTAVPANFARGCSALGSVTLTDSVKSIGEGAFFGCSALGSFTFPRGLESVGSMAFQYCSKITVLLVPDSVTAIGESAFANCSSLTEVSVPATLTSLSVGVFQNCTKLVKLNAEEGSDFNIPASVEIVDNRAFSGCISLTAVTIPKAVTKIGLEAFYSCQDIKTINFYAEAAVVEGPNPFGMPKEAYAASAANGGVTVNFGSETDCVKQIPTGLFCKKGETSVDGHKGITTVNFVNVKLEGGEGVNGWGANAFGNCTALKTVNFESGCSIPVINEGAFDGCTSLTSIVGMQNVGLQTIGKAAFQNCSALFRVTIGATVNEIRDEAFLGCERLIEVVNLSSLPITLKSAAHGRVAENALAIHTTDKTEIDTSNPNGFVFFSANNSAYLLGYTGDDSEITLPTNYNGKSYDIYKKAFYCNNTVTNINMDGCRIVNIGNSAFAGCTSLTGITFPSELSSVGETLLQDCIALTSVSFNGSRIREINAGMFSGCIELSSITIPDNVSKIGYQAFNGCSSLTTVNFGSSSDKSLLQSIDGYAFAACTSLEVVSLPSKVESVGQNAFDGCTKLSFVYLSGDRKEAEKDVIVKYEANVFNNCAAELILISQNESQYSSDINKNNLSAYKDKLTYIVNLNLIYDDGIADGGIHEVKRLFGRDDGAGYVQDGLRWIQTPAMPLQKDYSMSRWFSDASYNTPVDFDELTAKLKEEGVDTINLYARYIKQPNLVAKKGSSAPTYYEGMSLDVEGVIKTCFTLGSTPIDDVSEFRYFRYNITSHKFVDKTEDVDWKWDSTTGRVTQAGTYKLVIELEASTYGSWANHLELEFEINPMEIDISDKIIWGPDGNSSLHPTIDEGGTKTLYFYGDDVPYVEEHDGQVPSKTVEVINSYTIYSGKEITIHLTLASQYGAVVEASYLYNVGKEAGTYNAQVSVKPGNNYVFKYETTPTPPNIEKLGLSFRRELDGTMTVGKRWYIAISGANHLAAEDGGMYAIKTDDSGVAWKYLSATEDDVPKRPSLTHYSTEAPTLITFTLKLNGVVVGDAEKLPLGYSNERTFEKYVNSTMPAGEYELIFYIGDKRVDENTVITGNPNGTAFTFRVGEASLTKSVISDITDRKFIDTALSYNGNVNFASTEDIALLDPDNPSHPQVSRKGIWLNVDYDRYYDNFEISYFVKEGEKKNFVGDADPEIYFPISAYPDGAEGAIPLSIGSYTVFYKISAPNFSTVIKGRYELNITHTLEKPVLAPIEFAGGSIIDRVLMQLSDKTLDGYDIFTLRAEDKNNTPASLLQYNNNSYDSYIGLGEHYVFILIKEAKSKYIVWDSSISKDNFASAIINGKQRNDFLIVKFEIVATQNRELTSLSVNRWEFGEFDREHNKPNWVLQFSDDYSKYSFVLTSESGDKYYFYGDPDKALGENELGFDKAPAGDYVLTATAPADEKNGVYEFVKECDVTVDKANLRFTVAPFIDSWNYGNYQASNVTPDYKLGGLGSQVQSQIKVKYCTEAEYNKPKPNLFDIGSLLDESKQLPVGTYYLVYVLDGTDDFEPWQYGVRFKVLRAQNYWDKTPVIHDWVYGEYASRVEALDYKPHFGDASKVQLQYRTSKSAWVNSIEELNGFDAIAKELAVGTYEFRAVVPVSSNYEVLTFQTTFSVTKTLNGWKTVPGIKSWAQGQFSNDNKPIAEAKFGNNAIVYTVTDADGKEYDVNKLSSLGVGTYKLTATIAGNDNYEELSTVVYFNVLEDSVGMTGLMIATIIFSVIALGLAAAGITLLILRNRKAEMEFRKAVKNELRRK